MRLPLFASAALFATRGLAVFADEAWTLDYHYALFGEPQEDTTFFHKPNRQSQASLVYTLSDKGVAGAVNPRDGSVVWRQLLSQSTQNATPGFLRAGQSEEVVISGYEDKIAAWSAADGRQVWQRRVSGPVEDVEVLEIPEANPAANTKDAVVLSSGAVAAVQRIDGATGAVRWQHSLESGDRPYQVSASSTEVFVILLHKTMLGYIKIKVVSLDPVDGRKIDEYTLSSENELATADTIVSVGANSASPIIAWSDASYSVLKLNIVGTKAIHSFPLEKHGGLAIERVRLHAPYQIDSMPHFLIQYETAESHWADVFHIDLRNSQVEKAYSLPKLSGKGVFATSTSDANVYFTRITSDQIIVVSSTSHGILGRWPVIGFGVAAGREESLYPLQASAELSIKGESVSAIRTTVLLSTGDWVLLREGSPVWQRPEALASTVAATFVTPSVVADLTQQLEIEAHSNPIEAYIRRVTRHVAELQKLPAALVTLPQRFVRGFLGQSADGSVSNAAFGFNKIVACATENGRVLALDVSDPTKILWSRKVADVKSGESWAPHVQAIDGGSLLVTSKSDLLALQLNATTGEPTLDPLPIVAAHESSHEGHQKLEYRIKDGKLEAFKSSSAASASQPLWHFSPTNGERIVSLVPRPVNDPVASIGKVLGDRRVLYKYLDPNLALLVTANDALSSASLYVLNTVSGAIIHASSHTGVDLYAPIASVVSENWFAFSYTAEASESFTKGHYLVVGELFESLIPNDRGPLTDAANFSSLEAGTQPFTLSKTYQIPEPITKLAVTQTRQGITSRQLLAVLADSHSIIGIPYGAVDPRRPAGRDATKDEQAEGLVRYSPTIDFDPRWSLNHKRQLLGLTQVETTPALLESTSLVFAYGLDLFGTRLSPSFSFDILGKGFNKFQMLATVVGLAIATVAVAPLVMRKQVNQRWQFA